jgi:hypothetical protein
MKWRNGHGVSLRATPALVQIIEDRQLQPTLVAGVFR